jgi:fibronectin-binding autotransporter adhesin
MEILDSHGQSLKYGSVINSVGFQEDWRLSSAWAIGAQASSPLASFLSRTLRNVVLVLLIALCLRVVAAEAITLSSTWLLNPGSGVWNTAANWTPATVPTLTATFGASNTTNLTFSSLAAIGALQFNSGAPAYSFNLSGFFLTIGTGIVNNSSNAPAFTGGNLLFSISGSAANATITTVSTKNTAFSLASTGGQARLITNAGGTLSISLLTTSGMTAGSIEGAGTYTLGSKTLTVGSNNLSTEVSGTIGGTGGALIKVGTGTLTLSGANTYTGTTTISAGTLQIGNGGTSGSVTGNVIDNANLAFSRSDSVTFSGSVSGTGTLSQNGSGTLILTGTNAYTGGTTVSDGVLSVGTDAKLGNASGGLTVQGGELLSTCLIFSSSRLVALNAIGPANILAAATGTTANYSGVLSGGGSLQVGDGTNAGTVVLLSGANAYSGGTTVLGGATLRIDADAELGNASGGITLKGGKLVITDDGFSTARTLTLGLGINTLTAPDSNIPRFTTFTGLITGAGALTVGDPINSAKFFATLTNAGNDYAGGTTIMGGVMGGATLKVGTDGELGNTGGGLTLRGGTLQTTVDGFASARAIALESGAGVNTLASESGVATYTGVIAGVGGLTIAGGGTVVLAGNNTYNGGTNIELLATLVAGADNTLGTGSVDLFGGRLMILPGVTLPNAVTFVA